MVIEFLDVFWRTIEPYVRIVTQNHCMMDALPLSPFSFTFLLITLAVLSSTQLKPVMHRYASSIIHVSLMSFVFFGNWKLTQLQRYLVWRYPVRAIADGRPVPTCPYQWPNGQGDVAKFLEGEVNNKVWRKQHGHVYRIWTGMSPEM